MVTLAEMGSYDHESETGNEAPVSLGITEGGIVLLAVTGETPEHTICAALLLLADAHGKAGREDPISVAVHEAAMLLNDAEILEANTIEGVAGDVEALTQESRLVAIERRETQPTSDEWMGILHQIVMDVEADPLLAIRALAQMDRITGESDDLTEQAILDYRNCHLGITTAAISHAMETWQEDKS